MAFPVTKILDNFNRADEGPPPSSSWTNTELGGIAVIGNLVGSPAGDAQSNWNTSFDARQECFATLKAVPPNGQGISQIVRNVSVSLNATNHYEVFWVSQAAANDVAQIYKYNGSYVQLGADVSLGGEMAVDDVLGIRVVGTTIEVFRNGVSIASRTDGDVTGAGFLGLYFSEESARMDDFGGGSLRGPPFMEPRVRRGVLQR